MPVITGSLVIDAGGYEGEWTAGMISLYGCRSQIFEPVPTFFEHCQTYFKNNNLVQIHKAALGGSNLKKRLRIRHNSQISSIIILSSNGVSRYKDPNYNKQLKGVKVYSVPYPFKFFSSRNIHLYIFNSSLLVKGRDKTLDNVTNSSRSSLQFSESTEAFRIFVLILLG